MTLRIAMWSGPRSISTALMRSWENRPDCRVVDEPFYACYLQESGADHPCRQQVLASQSCDRREVAAQLSEGECGAEIFYQKHMTQHMPEGVDLQWCAKLRHCFLIRDPAEIISSYLRIMPGVTERDIGIARQLALFEEVAELSGERPLVIDCGEVLKNPAAVLAQLCTQWRIPWYPQFMLHWPRGRRQSDGVWASHWYQTVEQSTGFTPFVARQTRLSGRHLQLARRMDALYQRMARYRLKP